MSLPRPNESYHFQANLIWWDSPFKGIAYLHWSDLFPLPLGIKVVVTVPHLSPCLISWVHSVQTHELCSPSHDSDSP
jgi:hypothetical protein